MHSINICILGSTGSIGKQTLDVCRSLCAQGVDVFVHALAANKSVAVLMEQIIEFCPEVVGVYDDQAAEQLITMIREKGIDCKVIPGRSGLKAVATHAKADTVVAAMVGNIGIQSTVEAIEAGKTIALANKETLVSAGSLIMELAAKRGVSILPIDSEHSAIFQCLQASRDNKCAKILLTASGGPFRGMTKDDLSNISPDDALKHPNWTMGRKITIDSATLMNKGLEVIEAKWLFNMDLDNIEVVVHPQSIIHSMIEFDDGAILAQLGAPDMCLPIQYALCYPERVPNSYSKLDLFDRATMTFERPDADTFRCLALAYEAIKIGGTMPCIMNSANEVAVQLFLDGKIRFLDIPVMIERAMAAYTVSYGYSLDDILNIDRQVKEFVTNNYGQR